MKISNQEVLDRNVEWFLVKKMPRAANYSGGCVYHEEGSRPSEANPFTPLRCAVGCAIPEETAKELAENYAGSIGSRDADVILFGRPDSPFDKEQHGFLKVMQWTHDTIDGYDGAREMVSDEVFRERFEKALRKIAEMFALVFPFYRS